MHREKAHLQSTKVQNDQNNIEDNFPSTPTPNKKSNEVCCALMQREEIATAHQDLTGRFPVRSSKGNECTMVGCHCDANHIHGIPVKNRTASSLTNAWKQLQQMFTQAGAPPDVYVMDNEISHELKAAIAAACATHQLVTPYSHRRNLAERAIQTHKNHFKAGLATADPNFPLCEWDRLIPQQNITINLLRNARSNPKLSAHSHIHGEFNFSATPLAPPGTKVVACVDPKARGTWDSNGEVGHCVGPALNHCQNVEIHFPRTRSTRFCDTVTFFPHNIPFPKVTLRDHLRQAATDIVTLLQHPPASTVPQLHEGEETQKALQQIATSLKRNIDTPIPQDDDQSKTISVPRVDDTKSPITTNADANAPRVEDTVVAPRVETAATLEQLQQHNNTKKNQ